MRYGLTVLALAAVLVAASGLAMAEEGGPKPAPDGSRRPPGGMQRWPGSPGSRPARPPDGERPRFGEHGPFGRGPSIFRDVTDEQIESILAFMKEHMPWRLESLQKMQESDPERFRQFCRGLRFEIAQLLQLKERDEASFRKALEERQLKMRAMTLAHQVRQTKDARQKEGLTAQLREVLNRTFDLELATHEAHIRGLDERIEQLRRELKERAEHRSEIVEKRLKEALEGKLETPSRGPPKGPPKRGKYHKDGSRPDKPGGDEPPAQ